MNQARRKKIEAVKMQLEALSDDIDNILSDEQDYYDNIPENLQGSERASIAEDAISALENAVDSLSEAISSLEEAAG